MSIWENTKSVVEDFISLFYPELCLICNENLLKEEECVCIACLHQTQKTDCFLQEENEVSKRFWGRVKLENAAALFQFKKQGNAQKLIHPLKYEGGKTIGVFLGKQIAYAIRDSKFFEGIDLIMPVPLHPKKEKIRGYNQSKYIVKGINKILKLEVSFKSLIRIENTDSQTRKKRFSRWENMMHSFALRHPFKIKNKHILLVDDVVTTGSTMEACAQKLLEVEDVKVSIVTIGVA